MMNWSSSTGSSGQNGYSNREILQAFNPPERIISYREDTASLAF
jgi:hypothetical protein